MQQCLQQLLQKQIFLETEEYKGKMYHLPVLENMYSLQKSHFIFFCYATSWVAKQSCFEVQLKSSLSFLPSYLEATFLCIASAFVFSSYCAVLAWLSMLENEMLGQHVVNVTYTSNQWEPETKRVSMLETLLTDF